MGRVKFSESEHYGGGGGGSFFSLKNDKDVARVRFMLNSPEDLDDITYTVHRTKIGENYKSVSCLRSYNEPVSKCPFCEEYGNVQAKFFIPLYNVDEDAVQIFERGRTWAAKLSSLMSRYGSKSPLVNHIFELERNGAKGDMKTTYEPYEIDKDDTTLDDLPEIPEILGNVYVLDKTADDMNYYIETGEFPPEDEAPVQRRGKPADDFMNVPEDDEELPFEEEPEQGRGNRSGTSRRAATDNNARRRTPAGNNGAGNGRRNRPF